MREESGPGVRVLAAALAVAVAACGGADSAPVVEDEVIVSAAASLTDAFGEIEAAFEDANPGVDVVLNLGASSALREQILAGAPVDVFASADTSNMDPIVEAGLVGGEPRILARNHLQIAVPAGNPAGVTGLADLADEALLVGLCAETVPCGDLGRRALSKAGVTAAVDTNEPDVRALLAKIAAGELDAGIVYVTDVISAGGAVEGIAVPDDVATDYPIAVLGGAPNPNGAAAFVAFVLSEPGQTILAGYGFGAP